MSVFFTPRIIGVDDGQGVVLTENCDSFGILVGRARQKLIVVRAKGLPDASAGPEIAEAFIRLQEMQINGRYDELDNCKEFITQLSELVNKINVSDVDLTKMFPILQNYEEFMVDKAKKGNTSIQPGIQVNDFMHTEFGAKCYKNTMERLKEDVTKSDIEFDLRVFASSIVSMKKDDK